jgi:hypothetical protein
MRLDHTSKQSEVGFSCILTIFGFLKHVGLPTGRGRLSFACSEILEAERFFLSAFSVRARVVARAIPVFGFLADGIAFPAGRLTSSSMPPSKPRARAKPDAASPWLRRE